MKVDNIMDVSESEFRERARAILIECRHEKGVTQAELAKTIGKTENAVGAWEQGMSIPDVVTYARLAKYYKKTLEYMFGEEPK